MYIKIYKISLFKASEDVTIHNKDYREESYSRSFATPGYDVTDSVTIPYMDTYRFIFL